MRKLLVVFNVSATVAGALLIVASFFPTVAKAQCTHGGCEWLCIQGYMCGTCGGGHSVCNSWIGVEYDPGTESCSSSFCYQQFCVGECMNT
ncbi:MAG: hypothetical protein QOG23_1054 [Blastocatellia bacterium]|jgi:hypothetical protein|nr:hypothetical protein [Blastocatellia bacterium]